MTSDLDDGWLAATPEAFLATDGLLVDDPRRRRQRGGSRRALVHDDGDGLTVNFDGDYPGGVTVIDARLSDARLKRATIGRSTIKDSRLRGATLNLRVLEQGPEPTLPADGTPGDVLLLAHTDEDGTTHTTMWLCVRGGSGSDGPLDPGAWWQQVPLQPPVRGTA